MLPAGPLMIEHRLIERMIAALEKERSRLEKGGEVDVRFLTGAVDFMRTYADRCHHGKEEDFLFAKLSTKDMSPPMKAAMQRLIEDHVLARSLVKRLDDLALSCRVGDKEASREIQQIIAEMGMLYPDHIRREDKEFFPTAMTYLETSESAQMLADFEDFEHRLLHEKYQSLVKEVEKR